MGLITNDTLYPVATSVDSADEVLMLDAGATLKKATTDDIAQHTASRLGIFNVLDYGATGDGVTDDTAAIQATIDAAEAAGGGAVFVPVGIFVTGALTVTGDGVHLRGVGTGLFSGATHEGGTNIKAVASLTGDLLTISGNYCSTRDMTISGAGYGQNTLTLNDAGRFQCSNVYIRNAGQDGIQIGDGASQTHAGKYSDVFIIDCARYGMNFQAGSYDTQVSNLWIGNSGDAGLYLGSGNNTFANCHVWGGSDNGIEIRADHNRFANCYLDTNAGNGIDILDCEQNSFAGVFLWRNSISGLSQRGAGSGQTQLTNVLAQNNGQGGTGNGITIEAGDDTQLVNVNCFDDQGTKTQRYGVSISSGVNRTMLVNVRSRDADHLTGGILNSGTNTNYLGVVHRTANTLESIIVGATATGYSVDSAAATSRDVTFKTTGTARWNLRANSTAESGGDAGSNFQIVARTDAGAVAFTPVTMYRSDGRVQFQNTVQMDGVLDHDGSTAGFMGATPVARQAVGAAATDAASTQTLANNLRTALINLGLCKTA